MQASIPDPEKVQAVVLIQSRELKSLWKPVLALAAQLQPVPSTASVAELKPTAARALTLPQALELLSALAPALASECDPTLALDLNLEITTDPVLTAALELESFPSPILRVGTRSANFPAPAMPSGPDY